MDAVMRRKLTDLALLLEAWSREVDRTEAWDFEYLMHQAALRVGQAGLIVGAREGAGGREGARGVARVWVDGFSALSTLEMRMVVGLAEHAAGLTITLLADPESEAIREMRSRPAREEAVFGEGPFARTERLHRRLTDVFRKHQVGIEGTVSLREGFRFGDEALRAVEGELFSDGAAVPAGNASEAVGAGERVRTVEKGKKKDARRVEPRLTLFDLVERDEAPAAPAAATAGSAAGGTGGRAGFKTGVEVWESSDPETEVRVAAQAIRDLVIGRRGGGEGTGLRYRQIGVIVPDLEGYADALRRVFGEHAIPHFIDQRRGIAHHPLVELLRSAMAIATNRWDRDDLLLYLKTRLTGVTAEEVAVVENYLIEHGITHVPWSSPWRWIAPNRAEEDGEFPQSARDRLARINVVREKVYGDLRPWLEAASVRMEAPEAEGGEAREGAAYVRGLRALLERLQIDRQLQEWIDQARARGSTKEGGKGGGGEAELAQVHEQAWREVMQLLGLLESILSGKARTLQEVERLLNTALESLTLGLIPPTVDQVLVSSVTRSRVPELEVVLILGAVEGQFPKVVEEDPILSDAQREAFNARAADPINEGSDRQLLEMPFFDYSAFTRAGSLLVVSYPLATRTGKAVGRSRYVGRLRELLGERLVERKFDAASRTAIDRIGTLDDLLTAVAAWARERVQRVGEVGTAAGGGEGRPGALEALYNWVAGSRDPEIRRPMSLIWPCVAGKPLPRLSGELARRFYPPGSGLYLSISQLEKFAACPLQYFVHYTLGLRPREAFTLDQMHLGVLHHRILERIYRKIIADEIAWPRCEAPSLRAALEQEVDGAIAELHAELADREPGYEKTRARIKRHLGIILEADRLRACPGSLRPRAVEVFFGGRDAGVKGDGKGLVKLPILEVETAGKHRVFVNGKIDRIDADEDSGKSLAVIDYKSSARRTLELYRVLAGLALQLPVYAMVTRDLGRASPIAALYLGLGINRSRVAHAGEAVDPADERFYQRFVPHGIIDFEGMHLLDPSAEEMRKSAWYKMDLTKEGEPAKRSELLTHEDFQAVLDYARFKIAALADALMEGVIAPSPYRQRMESSCGTCDFASLCPFDRATGAYRDIPRHSNSKALELMRREMERGLTDGVEGGGGREG